jgi:hypothetical protein
MVQEERIEKNLWSDHDIVSRIPDSEFSTNSERFDEKTLIGLRK